MPDKTVGPRLAEDKWLIFNTLPYISEYLDTFDLLRCTLVCKLWHEVIQSPIFWKDVKFTDCFVKIDMCGFLNILRERRTMHLKIRNGCYCLTDEPPVRKGILDIYPRSEPNLQNKTLKTLEITQCPSLLCETFLIVARKLESIKIEMIAGSLLNLIKIDFIPQMSHLHELRLSHLSQIDDLGVVLADLRNITVLYLLNIENIFVNANLGNIKTNKLKDLALGNACRMPKDGIDSILRASPALKKLRFESCTHFEPHIFFQSIGRMENLTCLELLNFKIVDDFEDGVKRCANIKELTVMPSLDRFEMGMFNNRIYLAGKNMAKTVKRFTLGFSEEYLVYVTKLAEQRNAIPFNDDVILRNRLYQRFENCILLSMIQLEAKISGVMPGVKVKVRELDCLGNIFK